RKDFSLVFEYSIVPGHEEINNPNPFRGETMISEKINRWIAEYKAEGRAEGKAEGIEEGLEKGIEKGIEKGRAEGIIILLKEHFIKVIFNPFEIESVKVSVTGSPK
ncbi:MAG TPA: hypothetical protein DCX03_04410, partial [Bacteroidales bacterium]|nr:hypothetical protein [Bacteroidales bacterium]